MPTLTCLVCPNGCGLSFRAEGDVFYVGGNRCFRGVEFMERQLAREGRRGRFLSEKPFPRYGEEEIASLLDLWGRTLSSLEENRFIQGSPERSLYRTSLECGGERLILEQVTPDQGKKHGETARRLERMKEAGLAVIPYIRGRNGKALQEREGKFWRLTPLIQGRPLDRARYWRDSWRGEALGRFLRALYEGEKPDPSEPAFDLVRFINGLIEKISLHNADLLLPLAPVLHRLEDTLFPRYGSLPSVFGHGDPHPLNVIWGEGKIEAVIDWEFCGTKPILYDAALIMGCVGSESPEAFEGPFNRAFYREMTRAVPREWLSLLPDFILAQRFAWLNEWLRHGDEAMVRQELRYMEMLL